MPSVNRLARIAVDFIKEKYGDEKIELGILQFKTQIPETSAERVQRLPLLPWMRAG